MTQLLLFSVFVIATCGLVYELIAGTAASYLLGDSVTQFSTVIGTYLFAMGIGSYLSKYIHKNLIQTFIHVELIIGLLGGFSAALLFVGFNWINSFQVLLYSIVGLIGILVGLEIPLLMRIMQKEYPFKDLVSNIFTFDYIGALLASIVFPLVLVPHLGLIRSALLFGVFNVLVALWTIRLFKQQLPLYRWMHMPAVMVLVLLLSGFVYSDNILNYAEASAFPDPVIYATSSPYQRIVVTRNDDDIRLFLNGNLQFSSRDEYRYHEALIHVGMGSHDKASRILVLGGGDGMAVRELLKYPQVKKITLVDLDPAMTDLFKTHPILSKLNDEAFENPKVNVIHQDAFVWLRSTVQNTSDRFDFVVMDFPDPSNYALGKLYTDTFFKALKKVMADDGLGVIQSTSPYYAKKSYWCVVNTLKSVGLNTLPYHAYVPAFGDWGYILIGQQPIVLTHHYPPHLKFLTPDQLPTLTNFADDMRSEIKTINKLNNQALVNLFESEWSRYAAAH
jgi:spermidine synthase